MTAGSDRGAGWVVGQMLLLVVLGAAAPLWRGGWPVALSLVPGGLLLAYAAWSGLRGVRGLGKNLTPLPEPPAGGSLVTTGIYARLRHPLYSSLMAMGIAWALIWSSVPALVLSAVLCLFLHAKALREEDHLNRLFSEYAAYRHRVPRYVPRLRA